jgi:hypothetical protein
MRQQMIKAFPFYPIKGFSLPLVFQLSPEKD